MGLRPARGVPRPPPVYSIAVEAMIHIEKSPGPRDGTTSRRSAARWTCRGSRVLVGGMALAAAGLAACTTGGRVNGRAEGRAPRVGRDPVPAVHLIENHSSALLLWRRAGVRNRILVHLDGHADLDWLPD